MKFKHIIPIILISAAILSSCGSSEESTTTEITTVIEPVETSNSVYEDDFIKFEYNPKIIANIPLDSEGVSGVFSKLIDDSVPNHPIIVDLTGVGIMRANTNIYQEYQINYKISFVSILNRMLDIEELTESDISGKPSSNDVECNKILSNGNHLKAKILFIDEERFVIAYSLIGPNVHDSDVTELTKVYDSAVYKK